MADVKTEKKFASLETAKKINDDVVSLKEDLDNKIEHVGGYKEYDIGTPSVGTYWNKSAKNSLNPKHINRSIQFH